MPKIYRLSKSVTKLLYKARHHKGHGIHSPFVFSFVTRVIEEKDSFYAYTDIENHLSTFPDLSNDSEKINKLLFRIQNYLNPKYILELGAGDGISTLYLTASSSDVKCVSSECNLEKRLCSQNLLKDWSRQITQVSDLYPELKYNPDCIYVNLRNYETDSDRLSVYLLSLIQEGSYIVLDGIRTNKNHQMLWKRLIRHDDVTLSLDLFHLGILFFNKRYFKQNFKLSF